MAKLINPRDVNKGDRFKLPNPITGKEDPTTKWLTAIGWPMPARAKGYWIINIQRDPANGSLWSGHEANKVLVAETHDL